MPWSNQGGNGGRKGGGGPWGQGPSSGGQQPDLENILKRGQDRIRQSMPGGGMSRGLMLFLGLIALVVAAFYMFTVRINPDEVGIVTRFGKYDRRVLPGLNFRLPPPIEEVYTPRVTVVNRLEVGYTRSPDSRTGTSNVERPEESLMLTGDENIVDINFTVFWRIREAPEFLFNIQDGFRFLDDGSAPTVHDIAEASMREIVGKSDIQPILTQDRVKTEDAVKVLMQKILDSYKSGVEVTEVQMQKVDPPGEVIDAFRDVQAAKSDYVTLQNEAEKYAKKVVPEARGDAERIRREAEAYRDKIEAEATGQADRFMKVYQSYKQAPDITRKRIYLETLEKVFSNMDKIILGQGTQGQGVVPYLPLNELANGGKTKGGQ